MMFTQPYFLNSEWNFTTACSFSISANRSLINMYDCPHSTTGPLTIKVETFPLDMEHMQKDI